MFPIIAFGFCWAVLAVVGIFEVDIAPSGPRCLPADAVYVTKLGVCALTLAWGALGVFVGRLRA